ncbi:NAD-dependent epimerase/dehydratase family protein [Allomesorhizobium alhagi]|uniref:Nucleoside-diphosphate-sugar epimerase n=1 Tax=Mesorhizobium alhagi CCNWXJ12-2 TaxID=1107882 RepID=H0HT62_9HYPH|nr:NAD(P)-dependent oxidoreductase [Mesorhizobium alhagi]EHK56108.1 nucleoside-diphosphate-sugar epimerase [Mesorhizobium alhagi CCNWXJ12-2]
MTRVVVTGGSGKLGRACVKDLLSHGYEVLNVDTVPPAAENCPFVQTDLTDFGQAFEVLAGVDDRLGEIEALVHLAAIPAPGKQPNAATFKVNTLSTYNVFEAARRLKIRNVVWASSETVLGLPFDTPPPYAPVDEDYAGRPETAYSLSKLLGEEMAKQFCRWDPELKIIGLRFSNVMEPADYARFPSFDADARLRKWNLWAYIDARDASQAIRRALEAPIRGAEIFVIANADTVMSRPNAELMAEVYPGVPLAQGASGNETLLSIEKARRLLGYDPQHSWRGG